MAKPRVVTIVGTRPEIIRLSRLIVKLDAVSDHTLVHTGQNSDPRLNSIFFEDLGLRQPDRYLEVNTDSMGSVMGETLQKSEELLRELQPDAVMILGDTNSAIAAIVSERLHIPVYHMEAGNRSFDANVPEELNRKMVDHVSTFNLPYNKYSHQNLLREGIHPRFMQITGSPMREILEHNKAKIQASTILQDLSLTRDNYFLVSAHRQENVDNPEKAFGIFNSLEKLGAESGLRVIVSTHPRTKARLSGLLGEFKTLEFLEPFGFTDYISLQESARCVFSDSGTISEESAILSFRAVSIRDSIERPEALDSGHMILAGTTEGSIKAAYELALSQLPVSKAVALPDGYETSNFSEKVTSFLFSTYHLALKWKGIEKKVM